MKRRIAMALTALFIINLILNTFGINWGLPFRWNMDEMVSGSLYMLSNKTLLCPKDDFSHPTLFFYLLILFLCPYLAVLKLTNFPFDSIREAASSSWLKLGITAPDFASNIYLLSRFFSCLLGAACVLMVYFLGKEMFNRRVGVFSAAALSINMGFVSNSHFANSSTLANLIVLVSLYCCVKYLKHNNTYFLHLACLFAGLSITAKYNGAIIISCLIVCYSAFVYKKRVIFADFVFIKTALKSIFFFLTGLFMGWPTLFFCPSLYYEGLIKRHSHYVPEFSLNVYLKHLLDYFITLLNIFGLPMMIFMCIGLLYYIFKKRQLAVKSMVIIFVFLYLLIAASWRRPAMIKYIVLIVPVLCLFVGISMETLLNSKFLPKFVRYAVLAFVFLFTSIYTFSSDLIFAKNDTRYQLGRWVSDNVALNEKIEIFTQPAWLLSAGIFPKYNIVFMGQSSYETSNDNIFRAFKNTNKTVSDLEGYFDGLIKKGATSDYIVIPYLKDTQDYPLTHAKGDLFMRELLDGKFKYKLVKMFSPRNYWLWNVDTDYTSPVILVFRRTT